MNKMPFSLIYIIVAYMGYRMNHNIHREIELSSLAHNKRAILLVSLDKMRKPKHKNGLPRIGGPKIRRYVNQNAPFLIVLGMSSPEQARGYARGLIGRIMSEADGALARLGA